MQIFRVGEVSDFKNREKKIVIVDNLEVGIFRINNNFFAWKNKFKLAGLDLSRC